MMFFRVESNHVTDPIETTPLPQIEKNMIWKFLKLADDSIYLPIILVIVFCLKYIWVKFWVQDSEQVLCQIVFNIDGGYIW